MKFWLPVRWAPDYSSILILNYSFSRCLHHSPYNFPFSVPWIGQTHCLQMMCPQAETLFYPFTVPTHFHLLEFSLNVIPSKGPSGQLYLHSFIFSHRTLFPCIALIIINYTYIITYLLPSMNSRREEWYLFCPLEPSMVLDIYSNSLNIC